MVILVHHRLVEADTTISSHFLWVEKEVLSFRVQSCKIPVCFTSTKVWIWVGGWGGGNLSRNRVSRLVIRSYAWSFAIQIQIQAVCKGFHSYVSAPTKNVWFLIWTADGFAYYLLKKTKTENAFVYKKELNCFSRKKENNCTI